LRIIIQEGNKFWLFLWGGVGVPLRGYEICYFTIGYIDFFVFINV